MTRPTETPGPPGSSATDAPASLASRWSREESRRGVAPEDRSFFLEGDTAPESSSAVLLLHGAGGVPSDLRELGEHLARCGHPCLCPLLPAHGLGPKELGRVHFPELTDRTLESFDALARLGSRTDVVAQSMGAVLSIRLAVRRPVGRMALLAPALRPRVTLRVLRLAATALVRPDIAWATLRWQMEVKRGIRETRALLPRVDRPLLVLHSEEDPSVSIRGSHEVMEGVASSEKRLEVLRGQGHVLSRCPDRVALVFEPVAGFLAAGAPGGRETSNAPGSGSRTRNPPPGGASPIR